MRQCSPPPVSHVSHVKCQLSGVKCRVSAVRCQVPGIRCHLHSQTGRARELELLEKVHIPHLSSMSPFFIIIIILVYYSLDKVVKLVIGGSFINGATLFASKTYVLGRTYQCQHETCSFVLNCLCEASLPGQLDCHIIGPVNKSGFSERNTHHGKCLKTRPGDLVMPHPIG